MLNLRKPDFELSTLCGYGRYCHEGSDLTRTCKGRSCKCWCHKPYEIERRLDKKQKIINFMTSEIREHRIEIHKLKKELNEAIVEQQELRQRKKL